VLQWAREHVCPWNSYAYMYAAAAGQLEVLQCVRENDTTGEVWKEDLVRRQLATLVVKQEVLTWQDEISGL